MTCDLYILFKTYFLVNFFFFNYSLIVSGWSAMAPPRSLQPDSLVQAILLLQPPE